MSDRTLVLKLVTDARTAQEGAKKAEGGLKSLGATVKGLGAGLGIGLGLTQAMDFMGDAVNKASDLAEQQGKVGAVFDESADAVRAWARDLDHSYGITETAALSAVGSIGGLAKTMGLSESAAVDMGEKITQLAGDLSSFNNVPVAEALQALQSGLIGEAEPMRRFNVLLSDAAVQAEALASGLAPTKAAITEQVKVQARYNLIMRQTTKAQGDAARTSDTFAGKQRSQNVVVDEAETAFGTWLMNGLNPVIGAFTSLVDQAPNVSNAVGQATQKMRDDIQKLNDAKATDKDLIEQIIEAPGAFSEMFLTQIIKTQDAQISDYVKRHIELVDQLGVTRRELGLFIEAALASGKSWDVIDQMFADIRVSDFTTNWITGLRTMADMTSTEGQGIGNALSTGIQTGLDDLPELVGQQLADAFFRTDADRWKAAGQQIADWYSEPFMSVPDRLDRMSNRALKKAEWALEHHKGRIRRRSTEVAAALKNPIVRAAVESGTAVDVAVADFLVQQQKARTALAKWDRIRRTLFWFNGGGGNSAPPAQLPRGASPTAVASSAYGMTQAQAGFGRIASRNAAQAHYTVNVNAPASDPASVGQAVVRAIKAYESREGARWRSG